MMNEYNLTNILLSKQTYRKELSQKSFAEKLLIVENMRNRDVAIAKARFELSHNKKN